ncbi:MAG TPA: hypothetical protein VFH80_10315 [Solirubrobacteraceae bacterium]|nr:hypothetical protein [Solirubrobacteraceae bacterium]
MTQETWARVGRALLGRWPSQVAQWGESGIAAYVEELQADGLTPETALAALRSYRPQPGKDFPPSVAAVSQIARSDPSRPTFDEALTLWRTALRAWNRPLTGDYSGEAQMLRARQENVLEAAMGMHPLIASFIARHGVRRLQDEVGELDGEYGAVRRGELEQAWLAHVDAFDGRDVAALTAPRGARGLAAFDPLAALDGYPRRQLGAGTGA